jgi:hypothetical protein
MAEKRSLDELGVGNQEEDKNSDDENGLTEDNKNYQVETDSEDSFLPRMKKIKANIDEKFKKAYDIIENLRTEIGHQKNRIVELETILKENGIEIKSDMVKTTDDDMNRSESDDISDEDNLEQDWVEGDLKPAVEESNKAD